MYFLRKNLGLKVLTLMGAVALWVYVVGTSDLIYRIPEAIPVKFFNLSENAVIVSDKDITVNVAVKAPKKIWKSITTEHVEAYVDLKGLLPGEEHKLDVIVSPDIAEVSVYQIDPKKISVKLDVLAEKDFLLTLKIDGNVGDNYSVGDPIFSQREVVVKGAQSKVDSILEIRAPITLSQIETSEVKKSVALVAVDQNGDQIDNLIIEPASVDVTIPIQEVKQSKTFGIKANYDPNQLDGDAWIRSVTIVPPTIELLGDASVFENVDIITTEKIDLLNVGTSVERRTMLQIPPGLTLADPLNPFVTVKFDITNEQSTRKIEVPITIENIPTEYSLLTVSPAAIELELRAQKSLLQDLSVSDFKVTLDGSQYEPGTQLVTVTTDAITLPDGVDLADFTNQEITISIEGL